MSISWAYFRPQGPPRRQALQNQLPESLRAFDRQEGRIMSISWAYFRPQGPPGRQALQNPLAGRISGHRALLGARRCKTNCPGQCAQLTSQEGSIMSISWAYFRPQGPPRRQALQHQLPECAHLTRQEGSIMSISWAYSGLQGPPRRQALQNQLPESLRAFDEAGGEHHEHQLGIFPATGPS